MVARLRRLTPGDGLGIAAALAVAALLLGALAAVWARAGGLSGLSGSDWGAVRFTVLQAALSAALSVLLAVPVARALARRRFRGRAILITLFGAPFILPVIVAVLGLLAVYGRSGLLGQGLGTLGVESPSIFGLQGILLAHVFFNLPLAVRMILQGWAAIPAERLRLAAALGFDGAAIARHLERPMLRATLPGAFLVIFLICTTSFTVALALGGGPRATTVELAIYRAFRFDFDLGRAAALALLQVALCIGAVALARGIGARAAFGAGLDRAGQSWAPEKRAVDAAVLALAGLFLLLPLAMIVWQGAPRLLSLPETVYWSALRSLAVALGSTALTLALALPVAWAVARVGGRAATLLDGIGMLPIALSPLVFGIGLYLLLLPVANPLALALPITGLVNAMMSLPFALRLLAPAIRQVLDDYGPLAGSLGMRNMAFLRLVLLPRLRRPLGFSAGLAAALSMGDLGVIALFGAPDGGTLPLALYRLMGAYRMADAAGAALLLVLLTLSLFWIFDRRGSGHAAV